MNNEYTFPGHIEHHLELGDQIWRKDLQEGLEKLILLRNTCYDPCAILFFRTQTTFLSVCIFNFEYLWIESTNKVL